MEKKSKILLIIFSILILGSALVTYYRYIVIHDYQVVGTPATE